MTRQDKPAYIDIRGEHHKSQAAVDRANNRVVVANIEEAVHRRCDVPLEDGLCLPDILDELKANERVTIINFINRRMRNNKSMDNLRKQQMLRSACRWNDKLGRRENSWGEVGDRVFSFFDRNLEGPAANLWATFKEPLRHHFNNMDALPSMRVIQMAGPALDRCHVGVFNCAAQPIDSPKALADQAYILMQGTGGGFSVEPKHAMAFSYGKPVSLSTKEYVPIVVEDTTEGWCEAIRIVTGMAIDGYNVSWHLHKVRPRGSRLKTKGGWASGPEPLDRCLRFIKDTIRGAAGRFLKTTELHDITCMVHDIVQMGGVRRSSGISLFSLSDNAMMTAKDFNKGDVPPVRHRANNSMVLNEEPSAAQWKAIVGTIKDGGGGEPGIFWRNRAWKRINRAFVGDPLTNPCGEIILNPNQFCNLSIPVIRPNDTHYDIMGKVEMAGIWGVLQSSLTHFNYIDPEWQATAEKDRILGVDLIGHQDNEGFMRAMRSDPMVLQTIKNTLEYFVRQSMTDAGFTEYQLPHAYTTLKPGGNSGVFLGAAPGMKPYHSKYYIRRVRINKWEPEAVWLSDAGIPYGVDGGMLAFEFPQKAPDGAPTIEDVTAVDQLNHWRLLADNWADHNPSATIYVRPDEWGSVADWLIANGSCQGTGLSFLPFDGGVYDLAPFETITKERYDELTAKQPTLNPADFSAYEDHDTSKAGLEYACGGGACEV